MSENDSDRIKNIQLNSFNPDWTSIKLNLIIQVLSVAVGPNIVTFLRTSLAVLYFILRGAKFEAFSRN